MSYELRPEGTRDLDPRGGGLPLASVAARIGQRAKSAPPPTSANVSLDDIKKIPKRLAVAGGDFRHEVILAGLRDGFVTTLVTDERNASLLLERR